MLISDSEKSTIVTSEEKRLRQFDAGCNPRSFLLPSWLGFSVVPDFSGGDGPKSIVTVGSREQIKGSHIRCGTEWTKIPKNVECTAKALKSIGTSTSDGYSWAVADGFCEAEKQILRSRLPLRHRDRCTWTEMNTWCGPTSSAARKCLRRSWTAPSPSRFPLPSNFTPRTTVPFQGRSLLPVHWNFSLQHVQLLVRFDNNGYAWIKCESAVQAEHAVALVMEKGGFNLGEKAVGIRHTCQKWHLWTHKPSFLYIVRITSIFHSHVSPFRRRTTRCFADILNMSTNIFQMSNEKNPGCLVI